MLPVSHWIKKCTFPLSDSNKAISVNATESPFAVLTNLSHLFYKFSIAAVSLVNGTKVRGPPLDIVNFFFIIGKISSLLFAATSLSIRFL